MAVLKVDVEGAEQALVEGAVSPHARYEAPSYLATAAPDEARAACVKRGWMALKRQPQALD